MSDVLEHSALARWQHEPIRFIEEVLRDNNGQPYELFPAQREFFTHAWKRRDDGRLLYPEQCIGWIKKTGKTETAAMHVLTTTLVFGGRYAEAYCIASDLEQAQGRVFTAIKRMCECSPLLSREAEITQSRISFPQTSAVIQAIGSDYLGAAGAHPCISSFDELWTYISERSRRLWDEMIPVPTRKISCRLTTTHAGYENDLTLLLELYKRGLALPEIAPNLHAGNHLLFTWVHTPLSPLQTESRLAEMRQLTRPIQFLRQYENRFVTSESSFIEMSAWDKCVNPDLTPVFSDRRCQFMLALTPPISTIKAPSSLHLRSERPASEAGHSSCLPTITRASARLRANNREDPARVDGALRNLQSSSRPMAMQSTMQRLRNVGLPIEEYPQSPSNLTAASQNLFED